MARHAPQHLHGAPPRSTDHPGPTTMAEPQAPTEDRKRNLLRLHRRPPHRRHATRTARTTAQGAASHHRGHRTVSARRLRLSLPHRRNPAPPPCIRSRRRRCSGRAAAELLPPPPPQLLVHSPTVPRRARQRRPHHGRPSSLPAQASGARVPPGERPRCRLHWGAHTSFRADRLPRQLLRTSQRRRRPAGRPAVSGRSNGAGAPQPLL
ncbi:hypothetical protein PVAP13_7KG134555 [Panicum virgatum]|uniref:Uncharacterized protein n=1 Tax=Panicum virgatum TaxID=38727 RepID=A0A8T0QEE2_PANVG|nr:hypothetical protein PVAP13_7KG134555 [Panicum virgatum]